MKKATAVFLFLLPFLFLILMYAEGGLFGLFLYMFYVVSAFAIINGPMLAFKLWRL